MLMKKLIFVVIVFLSCAYFTSCFSLLDSKEKILHIVAVPSKGCKLKVVHIPSNATIQSAIQIQKIGNDKKEEVLYTYERYNFVDSYAIINDTTFMIVVRDTVSYLGNLPDTMYVKL